MAVARTSETFELWHQRIPGHIRLALAVLCQSWLDAFVMGDSALTNTDRVRYPDDLRNEGRRFLTSDILEIREDRIFWCDMTDGIVDAKKLQRAARKKLTQVKAAEAENRQAQEIALDRAFMALVDREANGTDPGTLTRELDRLIALESRGSKPGGRQSNGRRSGAQFL